MIVSTPEPWQQWGASQVMRTNVVAGVVGPIQVQSNQLVKIAYGRPESWNFWFGARLISGPNGVPGSFTRAEVYFDLTTGLGRSAFKSFVGTPTTAQWSGGGFERYAFEWEATAPTGREIWTTEALAPNRYFRNVPPLTNTTGNAVPPEESASPIRTVVGQNIQVDARIFAISPAPGSPTVGQPVEIEVTAYFAPVSHVRPDWFRLDGPLDVQFPGAEVGHR